MTGNVKMGYNGLMFKDLVIFFLRLCLVMVVWTAAWRLIQPKTQSLRILRAALIALTMLAVLALVRFTTG